MPPLNYLSEKLNLTPSVAGVTLMALGNGEHSVNGVWCHIELLVEDTDPFHTSVASHGSPCLKTIFQALR